MYPVALVTVDGQAEVHVSFDDLLRFIEEPEIASAIVVDSDGRSFLLEAAADKNAFDRLLSAIGTPQRIRLVLALGQIAPEIIEAAKSALASYRSES